MSGYFLVRVIEVVVGRFVFLLGLGCYFDVVTVFVGYCCCFKGCLWFVGMERLCEDSDG